MLSALFSSPFMLFTVICTLITSDCSYFSFSILRIIKHASLAVPLPSVPIQIHWDWTQQEHRYRYIYDYATACINESGLIRCQPLIARDVGTIRCIFDQEVNIELRAVLALLGIGMGEL